MGSRLTRNPDLVWRDEPEQREKIMAEMDAGVADSEMGWVIIVDSGEINQLNLIAGDIWMLCDGSRDEAEIADAIAAAYDADPSDISADVAEFINDCLERGWLLRG